MKLVDKHKALKLIESGFSLLTTGGGKIPNFPWKRGIPYDFFKGKQVSEQDWESAKKINISETAFTSEQFEFVYEYKGGLHHWNNSPKKTTIPATQGAGIITGYDYLEVIDVDLKVFSTAKEQNEFWEIFISYLEDSILDFHEKVVIAKTRNNGFHLLYKTKRVQGNLKLAKLKGHTEAVIETRGIGGYVFIYDRFLNDRYYTDVDFISDEDRNKIMEVCDSFDYKVSQKIEPPKKVKKSYEEGHITPWDDFNQKNTVWDIVSDEFTIVRQQKDRIIIKRKGANSVHSGYIFHDNGCMYLHSTGTRYDTEKQISAFDAYCIKEHSGDYSEAAKKAYTDGYGSRFVKKEQEPKEKPKVNENHLTFPIEIFPESIQNYLLECKVTLNNSIDYMGCSLLWLISVSIGNSMKIEVIPGWTENSTIWMSIVGKPGWGKTPSIKRIISPLLKLDRKSVV